MSHSIDQLLNEVFQNRFHNFRLYLQQRNIERLDLTKKNLGTKNLSLLSKALAGTAVSAIDLSHNQIDDKGLTAFAKNLTLTNLRVVNLGDNEIGDKGALNFATKIRKSKVVSWLLPYNSITMKGACTIAKALTGSPLTFLDLSGTDMSSEDTSIFIQNLQGSNVRKITLQLNQLTDERIWEMIDHIPKTSLTSIDLALNREISADMHQRLKQALIINEKPLLMMPYHLWALNKLQKNKPGWSNRTQEALKTAEEKFKAGTEILVNIGLPREIRDLIIQKIYPAYTSKVGASFTRLFDERKRKREEAPLKSAIPLQSEIKKQIKQNRTRP